MSAQPHQNGSADVQPKRAVRIPPPMSTRLGYFARIWVMKFIVNIYVNFRLWWNILPKSEWPTYTKRYSTIPDIEARVFIPRSYKSGDKPLPLYIDVHGGGFCIGHPLLDDPANATISQKHGMVVVAIGYRLAPGKQFPTLPLDVAAQIREVISDKDLPVDRTKIALAGYSAGGNLVLAAAQLYGLHDQVKAAVAYYPSVDLVTSVQDKLKTRVSDGKTDMLATMAPAFSYCYVPNGVDRHEPLVSPTYAPRDKLPKHIYMIGCEHDLLCNEARVMAEKLAQQEIGQQRALQDGEGWQKGNVRWELIKGEIHGFNMVYTNKVEKARRKQRSDKMFADVAKWLHEEVFV